MNLSNRILIVLACGLFLGLARESLSQQTAATEMPRLELSSDFAGGSGVVEEIDQKERRIRLSPTAYPDRGWACWWYVKVSGIKPGETITLDVGEAPWATPDRAMFSLDQQEWRHTDPGERHERRIVYRQQIDANEAWFAWGPPFTHLDAAQLVEKCAAMNPRASAFELCKTREDRGVPALVVNEPGEKDAKRLGIWIQARQHAWESGSSWVCQGLAEWLVSDDDRAAALRAQAEITIVPVMDIDSVAIGAGGKGQVPRDHNRDWGENPHWKSVAAAMERITRLNEAGRFHLFIDLHNPSASSKHPFYYITPREQLTDSGQRNLDRFLAASRLEMTGPLDYVGETHESGPQYDQNWKLISKNWVSQNTRPDVVAVTLETAWNTPHSTVEGYQTVGRQLGLAIERHFRGQRQSAE